MNETSTLHNNQKLMGICRVLKKHFGTLTTHAKIAVIGICTTSQCFFWVFISPLSTLKQSMKIIKGSRSGGGGKGQGVEINRERRKDVFK